jgi:hypothetical protein
MLHTSDVCIKISTKIDFACTLTTEYCVQVICETWKRTNYELQGTNCLSAFTMWHPSIWQKHCDSKLNAQAFHLWTQEVLVSVLGREDNHHDWHISCFSSDTSNKYSDFTTVFFMPLPAHNILSSLLVMLHYLCSCLYIHWKQTFGRRCGKP